MLFHLPMFSLTLVEGGLSCSRRYIVLMCSALHGTYGKYPLAYPVVWVLYHVFVSDKKVCAYRVTLPSVWNTGKSVSTFFSDFFVNALSVRKLHTGILTKSLFKQRNSEAPGEAEIAHSARVFSDTKTIKTNTHTHYTQDPKHYLHMCE